MNNAENDSATKKNDCPRKLLFLGKSCGVEIFLLAAMRFLMREFFLLRLALLLGELGHNVYDNLTTVGTAVLAHAVAEMVRPAFRALRKPLRLDRVMRPAILGVRTGMSHSY